MASAGIRPDVQLVEGTMLANDFEPLRQWVELNRGVLIRFRDGEIEYTDDALDQIRGI